MGKGYCGYDPAQAWTLPGPVIHCPPLEGTLGEEEGTFQLCSELLVKLRRTTSLPFPHPTPTLDMNLSQAFALLCSGFFTD